LSKCDLIDSRQLYSSKW